MIKWQMIGKIFKIFHFSVNIFFSQIISFLSIFLDTN